MITVCNSFPVKLGCHSLADPCPWAKLISKQRAVRTTEPDREHWDATARQWEGEKEDGRNSPPSCRPRRTPNLNSWAVLEEPRGLAERRGALWESVLSLWAQAGDSVRKVGVFDNTAFLTPSRSCCLFSSVGFTQRHRQSFRPVS